MVTRFVLVLAALSLLPASALAQGRAEKRKRRAKRLEELGKRLEDPDPEVRLRAATAIRSIRHRGSHPAIPYLLPALSDSDVRVRRVVAEVLHRRLQNYHKAVPIIAKAIADKDAEVRLHITFLLGKLCRLDPSATAPLVRSLGDSERDVRAAAVRGLGRSSVRNTEATAGLLSAVGDRDRQVQTAALEILSERFAWTTHSAPALVTLLESEDKALREAAYKAFAAGHLRAEDALPFLRKLLASEEAASQLLGAKAAGNYREGLRELAPRLIAIFKGSEDLKLKTEALQALGALGGPEALPVIIEASADERFVAVASRLLIHAGVEAEVVLPLLIKQLEGPGLTKICEKIGAFGVRAAPAVPALLKIVESGEVMEQLAAIDALGKIQTSPELVVPLLAKRVSDPQLWIRRSAAVALGKYGLAARSAAPALRAAVRDSQSGIRYYAAEALGAIGDRASLPGLLEDKDLMLRVKVAHMLGRDGPETERAVKVLGELAGGPSQVRAAALRALEDLGPTARIARGEIEALLKSDDPGTQRAARRVLKAIDAH